ncbi:ABC transporter ATP-binding protein [Robbsia sp. KACC 23696]|uniref:ABC transporter ATP-binding protein n=1 Tax=Robbsia sp. KACC 23696 TaxID=3149231 RepID=UPI00325BCE10
MAMLEVVDLAVAFGGFRALNNVNLTIEQGSITGLIGPNGAGKSTLLNALGGSIAPDRGDVRLCGTSIRGVPGYRRARMGLTRTFQIARELSGLTVLENVMLGARRQRDGVIDALFRRRAMYAHERQLIEKAMHLLRSVGLDKHTDASASSLSGGQKKLLELVRAMMGEPRLLLLDEPAAGVNPTRVNEVVRYIQSINRDHGVTVCVVEHNMDMISALCDTVYVLAEGRVLTQGTFEEVRSHADVAAAYLGVSL